MRAAEAGDALTDWVQGCGITSSTVLIQLGLIIAFHYPEYARALCDAGGSQGDEQELARIIGEFVRGHPIEVPA